MKLPVMSRLCLMFVCFFLFLLCCAAAVGKDRFSFSRIDHQQGLSNSAVLSIFQDREGLMWFGTYDGINCYDGRNMEVFRSDFSKQQTLNNNIIHSIQQADEDCLWITTHLGLNRFSLKMRQVVEYYNFAGDYYVHSNHAGNAWQISPEGVSYYNTYHKKFVRLKESGVPVENMDCRAFVAQDGVLWTFPRGTGKLVQFSVDSFDKDTLSVRSAVLSSDFHSNNIDEVFYQNGIVCFVDENGDLYIYDVSRRSKIYVRNLSSLIQRYGKIAGIVPFCENIIVAFRTNGLVRLCASHKYEEEVVNRNIRIYNIYRDPNQNILWIASDGQGAIMYAEKSDMAMNLMLDSLSPNLNRQVRSVMTDKYGGLWLGTKGDGLLHIPNYEKGGKAIVYSPAGWQEASDYIRWDKEFQVYSLKESRFKDIFWIGAGTPGLYYYSFANKTLCSVEDNSPDPVNEVHDIYEEEDSILYVVTAGSGFRRLVLEQKNGRTRIKSQKHYHFYYKQDEITMFYPMLADGDSVLWLGSREKGLVRFDKRTEEYEVISLKERLNVSVDDILSLYRATDGRLYVGTTSGLVCLDFSGQQMACSYVGKEQGLLNDMIHGILEDGNGLLWLSTNRGLIKYNPKNGTSHTYYYTAGIQVGEFSDDAYYQCPYTGRLFFGGIDGLVYLDKEGVAAPEYYPNVILRKMTIDGKDVLIGNCLSEDGKRISLERQQKVSFSFSFVAPDFLAGENIEYSFMLEGYDKDWSLFSSRNEVSYVDVPSGHYVFRVRYKKDVFSTEYTTFSMPIHILPPWYLSSVAYVFYSLLFLLAAGYLVYLLRNVFEQRRIIQRLSMAESNRSLPDIHIPDRELLNRFTAIYRAGDQLRAEHLPDAQRFRIAEQIHETVIAALFRPGTLAKEQLGSFFPTAYSIKGRMCMKELSQEVVGVLESQKVDLSFLNIVVAEQFTFPVYKNLLRCVLYGCYLFLAEQKVSSTVTVEMKEREGGLLLQFSSVVGCEGIKALYRCLSDSDFSARMIEEKKNTEDALYAWHLLVSVQEALQRHHIVLEYTDRGEDCVLTLLFEPARMEESETKGKLSVLLLEDRDEMVWLISDLLAEEFVVRPVKTVQLAFEEIRHHAPALFLADLQVYVGVEDDFMKYVANNRALLETTAFIPMFSWEASHFTLHEVFSWADFYVVLPYDILFLREVIHRVIYGKREEKVYIEDLGYLPNQIVCVNAEQRDFVGKLLEIIRQNLQREDLGSALLASDMGMSQSQFYRKFKDIFQISPSELIKDYRMERAARLLQDEKLSIQDVMFEVGISSRSYFYKEFSRRFGMTPKNYQKEELHS